MRTVPPNRRKIIAALLALAAASPGSPTFAQRKVWRIGFLGVGSASAYAYRIDALKVGLRDHGYTEGQNVVMEYRWANGNTNLLLALAHELLQARIDVLVTHGIAGASAARQATSSMPIVVTDIADIVASGLVTNLARPGGNITGSTFQAGQLNGKRLELLKGALPGVVSVGFLLNPGSPTTGAVFRETELAAKAMNVELQRVEARQPADFEPAFAAMAKARVGAVLVQDNPLFTPNRKVIADLAAGHRLPAAGYTEFAEAGGMIGYGLNFIELYQRAADFVDRIFKGAKPAELPMEQPTKFELVLNLKTAKQLGIVIPQWVYARADKVLQ